MLGEIIFMVIGLFVGWNLPQPKWAKIAQEWITNKFKELASRINSNDKN